MIYPVILYLNSLSWGQTHPPGKTTSCRHPVHILWGLGLNHCVPPGFLRPLRELKVMQTHRAQHGLSLMEAPFLPTASKNIGNKRKWYVFWIQSLLEEKL